jgi:hypothetical protein
VFEISGAFVVAPMVAGTAGGQTATNEAPVTPFAHVTVGDANVGATDTLTITLGGAGGTHVRRGRWLLAAPAAQSPPSCSGSPMNLAGFSS